MDEALKTPSKAELWLGQEKSSVRVMDSMIKDAFGEILDQWKLD